MVMLITPESGIRSTIKIWNKKGGSFHFEMDTPKRKICDVTHVLEFLSGEQCIDYLNPFIFQFAEFHARLCTEFPLTKFHGIAGYNLGRSNVREVAERRKVRSIRKMLFRTYIWLGYVFTYGYERFIFVKRINSCRTRISVHNESIFL